MSLRNEQNRALAYIDSQILQLRELLREWEQLKATVEASIAGSTPPMDS